MITLHTRSLDRDSLGDGDIPGYASRRGRLTFDAEACQRLRIETGGITFAFRGGGNNLVCDNLGSTPKISKRFARFIEKPRPWPSSQRHRTRRYLQLYSFDTFRKHERGTETALSHRRSKL